MCALLPKELLQASKDAELAAATARTLAEFNAAADNIRMQLQMKLARGQQPQASQPQAQQPQAPQATLKPAVVSIKNLGLEAAPAAAAEAEAGAGAAAPAAAEAGAEAEPEINSKNNKTAYLTGLAALRHPEFVPLGLWVS